MIKKLLITYLFLITNVFAGLPPTTMRGQSQTLKPTTFNFQVPNKQATITAASTSLIETGNNNELENRGFEHTTVTTGWTISNATSSSSTTRIEGSKSLSLALTGALSLSQSSTINAAQKSGVQMVASIWVNSSDVSDLQLCSLKNGSEDKCTVTGGYVQGSGWRQLTVYFLGDTTSNGLKLKSTDTTGTVLVDQAYVGIGSPFVDFTPDMVYSAKVSSTGVVSDENTNWLNGNCTGNAPYTCQFVSGIFTTTPNCYVVPIGGSRVTQINGATSSSQLAVQQQNPSTLAFTSDTNMEVFCQKQGADYKTSKAYVASSSDTDWASCGHTTSDFTGFGTVSSIETQCKRDGSDLLMRGRFLVGSSTSVEARLALKLNGSALTSAGTSFIPSTQIAGSMGRQTSINNSLSVLIEPSVGYVTFGGGAQVSSMVTKQNGSSIAVSGDTLSLFARIPIQGWTDSGVIVGSFEGIEKCANPYECTDTFSAQISATGVVSNQNIPWISSVSSTSPYTITYNTNLKDGTNPLSSPMNCSATVGEVSNTVIRVESSTSSSVLVRTVNFVSPGTTNNTFFIVCQKGTNDYKPKTAKIASSIGVPTVPGVTTQAIDTFSVSYGTTNATTACSASPCSYLDQIGNAVTSITRAAQGSYSLNTSKTYSKLKCTWAVGGATPQVAYSASGFGCANCSALSFKTLGTATTADADSWGTLICQGIPQ